jgi:hypothetical protein
MLWLDEKLGCGIAVLPVNTLARNFPGILRLARRAEASSVNLAMFVTAD